MRMYYFANVLSSIKGVKEMSEDQEQLIRQVQTAKSECEQEEKKQARNKIIGFVVLGMFIVALFMTLA